MDFLIGIRTEKFVILASDKNAFEHGALKISDTRNKTVKFGEQLYMSCCGEPADVDDFGNWAQANLRLYNIRHGYALSPQATHYWLRQNIANNLRTENYWQVNLLVGGFDKVENKAYLGTIDYLGNSIPDQNYLFVGFPGTFGVAILDSLYKKDMTEEEALTVLQKVVDETKKRVIVNFNKYGVLVINKDGTRHLEDIAV